MTDGQTDGQTARAIAAVCIASNASMRTRCKKWSHLRENLSQMRLTLWSRKSPLNYGSHPDPENGSGLHLRTQGPDRICPGGGLQSPSALVFVWAC